ncbi:multiprotein-bridging factor 1 family protein [Actinoplanes sp. GCM10030250]|uniref:helix-turn-helix domain-containing protein n=1 Tax=Actinoplanes sp. GCM10030250 TaxID=3273376 RepID=UPI0036202AC0
MRKGWSQLQLANRMNEAAKHHDGTAQLCSLVVMISKWENGAKVPGEYNRRLLAETLGITVADLGLAEDPDFLW